MPSNHPRRAAGRGRETLLINAAPGIKPTGNRRAVAEARGNDRSSPTHFSVSPADDSS